MQAPFSPDTVFRQSNRISSGSTIRKDGSLHRKSGSHRWQSAVADRYSQPARRYSCFGRVVQLDRADGTNSPLFTYNSKIINIASKLPTITIIGFVHDLESLRVKNISESNEYKRFNDFDGLIVLTNQMKQWFIKRGYKGRIVTIDMWDYLMKEFSVHDKEFNTIAFAGNLNKSAFIDKLKNLNTSFSLYGKCDEKRKEQIVAKNVRYRGMFLPDELPYKINDGWGLVWDGDSIECCSGDYGEYLSIIFLIKQLCIWLVVFLCLSGKRLLSQILYIQRELVF